uniref:Uncharacterized protein n=1 Tax=Kalanchoe fedtschenkoi TaxID=63787 RepID=A0A7N0ZQJ1_KALFE
MGQIIQKEAAPEVDDLLQGGNGASHHPGDNRGEFLKVVIDEGEEKKGEPEKISSRGGSKNKKVGKPPRHPRGPSLVAADRRFIEQMVLKRIKTERVKELSRRDHTASSSSESLLVLLVIIIVLCFLILFRISEPWRRWSSGIIHA